MSVTSMKTRFLGQVCVQFYFENLSILVDPYFSESVARMEGVQYSRLVEVPLDPSSLTDIDAVLITHAHLDHCDPDTLVPLSKSLPDCRIYGPPPVIDVLVEYGIKKNQLVVIEKKSLEIGGIRVIPVPASHPEIRSVNQGWESIGYVFESGDKRIYHAGDTSLADELIDCLSALGEIDLAFIPVNEASYYKARAGIVGNMSIRDAFGLCEQLGIRRMVPTHWDMFHANSVFPEEIELLYRLMQPSFEMSLVRAGEEVWI